MSTPDHPAPSSRGILLPVIVAAIVSAIISTIIALALGGSDSASSGDRQPASAREVEQTASTEKTEKGGEGVAPLDRPADGLLDVSALYSQVQKAVAFIRTESSTGSGFVVDASERLVITNEHVVDAGGQIRVRVGTSGQLTPATLVAEDPAADLALLRVSGSSKLTELALGRSGDVEVGEPAIAIGSPFGLQGTLTTGIVSALQRPIEAPNGFTIEGALQTDAAINPGNSGGPLLDGQGRVIGVNAQIATESGSSAGVGFAIPVDTVRASLESLRKGQTPQRAYMGVTVVSTDDGRGSRVAQVASGGPAANAGLRSGDVILSVGGTSIDEQTSVLGALSEYKPGDTVTVKIKGSSRELRVRLARQPASVASVNR